MRRARDRRLAAERLQAMQDRMMAGEVDTGTTQTYIGKDALPPSSWVSDSSALQAHLSALERAAEGKEPLPTLTPAEAELVRQAKLHRAQLRAHRGLEA